MKCHRATTADQLGEKYYDPTILYRAKLHNFITKQH